MQRFIVFSVLLLLSHAASVAHAATYYVGQNVAGASDDNDGLASESGSANRGPWKTLSKAAAVAGAGDRVWVFDGDYRDEDTGWGVGHIPIVNSGEATDRMIVFQAADLATGETCRMLLLMIQLLSLIRESPGPLARRRFGESTRPT